MKRKGQMMLITAVIVSLMLMATGSAIAEIGQREYESRQESYMTQMIQSEASEVDKRFTKNRENYEKMVGFIDDYTTTVEYSDAQRCFNVTLNDEESVLNIRCTG